MQEAGERKLQKRVTGGESKVADQLDQRGWGKSGCEAGEIKEKLEPMKTNQHSQRQKEPARRSRNMLLSTWQLQRPAEVPGALPWRLSSCLAQDLEKLKGRGSMG